MASTSGKQNPEKSRVKGKVVTLRPKRDRKISEEPEMKELKELLEKGRLSGKRLKNLIDSEETKESDDKRE